MNNVPRQATRRRTNTYRVARRNAQRQAKQTPSPEAPLTASPSIQETPVRPSEAPAPVQQAQVTPEAENTPQPPTDPSTPTYPTDWKTEEHYDLPHITLYQEETPLAALPVETFLEIAEEVSLRYQPAEERTDYWVISAPEDPTATDTPHLINLMDGVRTKYQLAIDEELATAIYSIVKDKANVPDEAEKGWFAWARRNKKKAYTLYGFGGIIVALFLYNSVVSFVSPLVGN